MAQRQEDPRLLLRIPEAAARLGLGRSTVYELIQAGELPVVRIGKSVRIPSSRLEAWVELQARTAEGSQHGDAA
jgi:excisionase family DNA binding protein